MEFLEIVIDLMFKKYFYLCNDKFDKYGIKKCFCCWGKQ